MAEFEEWVGGGFVGAGEVEEAGFLFRHCCCSWRELDILFICRGWGDCRVLFRRYFV